MPCALHAEIGFGASLADLVAMLRHREPLVSCGSRHIIEVFAFDSGRRARELSSVISSALLPVADELRRVVGDENVLAAHRDLVVYECDGFVIEKNCPDVVVFPRIDRATWPRSSSSATQHDVPFVPRGAGTSLAGGCLPVGGGVMIVLTRMKRDSRDQPPRSLRRRRAGRGQRLADATPSRGPAITTPPIRRARGPARSAATWPPTPAARTRSSTASRSITCWASKP